MAGSSDQWADHAKRQVKAELNSTGRDGEAVAAQKLESEIHAMLFAEAVEEDEARAVALDLQHARRVAVDLERVLEERLHAHGSTPCATKSAGATTLPSDLDILTPLLCRNP